MSRKPWPEYWLDVAAMVATRSTCPRLSVGCVLVKGNRIIASGYNGAPSGAAHCEDVGCDVQPCRHYHRGLEFQLDPLHPRGHCGTAIHAEENALINALIPTWGAALYCTHEPCPDCTELLHQAGVTDLRWRSPYPGQPLYEPASPECRHGKRGMCTDCLVIAMAHQA